ncbi:MAG: hypothetical protein LBT46_09725 [Planctomycetaceae bacterium]|nr:hypothetical protein [Planctomycetaceae bacterium]
MFDYTQALKTLCEDICFRVPELRHIEMNRVAVSFSQTKNSEPYGIYASTTPLRFSGGNETLVRRGRTLTMQSCYKNDGTQYLYILYFYVPRFIELPLSQKLDTIVHELYHISPLFNGDLRRFSGRCFAHGSSKAKYDQSVKRLTEYYLQREPPESVWSFLQLDYRGLTAQYGKLTGTKIPMPKIVPQK